MYLALPDSSGRFLQGYHRLVVLKEILYSTYIAKCEILNLFKTKARRRRCINRYTKEKQRGY